MLHQGLTGFDEKKSLARLIFRWLLKSTHENIVAFGTLKLKFWTGRMG